MNAEQIIKQALDGWFFTYEPCREQVRGVKVPTDHIPDHRPVYPIDMQESHNLARRWTVAEDDTLLTLRNGGMRWVDVGKALKVSPTCALKRYQEVCLARGLEPLSNEATKHRRYSPALCERVISLRQCGLQFQEIAKATGLTTEQANHIFIRWRRRENRREAA